MYYLNQHLTVNCLQRFFAVGFSKPKIINERAFEKSQRSYSLSNKERNN